MQSGRYTMSARMRGRLSRGGYLYEDKILDTAPGINAAIGRRSTIRQTRKDAERVAYTIDIIPDVEFATAKQALDAYEAKLKESESGKDTNPPQAGDDAAGGAVPAVEPAGGRQRR